MIIMFFVCIDVLFVCFDLYFMIILMIKGGKFINVGILIEGLFLMMCYDS